MIRGRGRAAFRADLSQRVRGPLLLSPDDAMVYEEGEGEGRHGRPRGRVDRGHRLHRRPLGEGAERGLIGASADALAAAIALVEPGRPVSEIGAAVERMITRAGFEPVRNLTGHGLDRWKVHCAPQIPSYGERGGGRLQEGSVIAIEPFACTGRGFIHEAGKAEVFMLVRPPRKAKGIDKQVLRAMQGWNGVPIARRYFNDLD